MDAPPRRQGGSRRAAETEEWIEGAVESFSERIKAREID